MAKICPVCNRLVPESEKNCPICGNVNLLTVNVPDPVMQTGFNENSRRKRKVNKYIAVALLIVLVVVAVGAVVTAINSNDINKASISNETSLTSDIAESRSKCNSYNHSWIYNVEGQSKECSGQ